MVGGAVQTARGNAPGEVSGPLLSSQLQSREELGLERAWT